MSSSSALTSVIYVQKQDAKHIKTYLEQNSLLDKRFRLVPVSSDNSSSTLVDHNGDDASDHMVGADNSSVRDCIAVPVIDKCMELIRDIATTATKAAEEDDILTKKIVHYGTYNCPYSTSMLGNNNNMKLKNTTPTNNNCEDNGILQQSPLTNVQHALLETLTTTTVTIIKDDNTRKERIEHMIRKLSKRTCPTKLEVIGNDRTLVIPRHAFYIGPKSSNSMGTKNEGSDEQEEDEYRNLLLLACSGRWMHDDDDVSSSDKNNNSNNNNVVSNDINDQVISNEQEKDMTIDYFTNIQSLLWKNLANTYNTSRIVRRGDINPESGVRESGHRILYPIPSSHIEGSKHYDIHNTGYLPEQTGPSSPGWITITEHTIHQSFDITRVMFSRGNVTEKKRFGVSCVKANENVLDMYAGIGYYTLPALILGRAKHVTACEWNKEALFALRYNLNSNNIKGERVSILEGDCRVSLKRLLEQRNKDDESATATRNPICQFDRISLGLLPSSEGGWDIAVACLNQSAGGWLHVHGNVPTAERTTWTHWLCRTLTIMANTTAAAAANDDDPSDKRDEDWIAVCIHVEKVKSFAPKVDHLVADVYVGPWNSPKVATTLIGQKKIHQTGIINSGGEFVATPLDTSKPSCALSEEGILHQNWMR